ncbi:MAG: response regulator transcription factor [Labilithrix sp.]|nr:response regulator transcription factor [Labilithrix sp.]MCW5815420.1 response regulator transcription factor [Labilithrix sp.]
MVVSSDSKRKPVSLQGRRVLVVEDDPSIAIGLRINLESEGYEVHVADDGERGLELARTIEPDLVILDVMLPRRNGLEVLHELRNEGRTVPVIILSAKSTEMDKVAGLELGAEDYVAKPFSLAELLARVRGALRRTTQAQATSAAVAPARPRILFGDVEVDVAARTIKRKGELVDVTATEFDVLVCLVSERGRAMSRDDIFRRVWGPNHHGTPRTVDNFIQQLRAKLEVDPQEPAFIQTVRGVGYRFDFAPP